METNVFGNRRIPLSASHIRFGSSVSNDAVNFMNSAIGAKAASFKPLSPSPPLVSLLAPHWSNGMMDIARHGIFRPEQFYFQELMCIFLAVMVTDVVLLDIFNSLGMPTSTTVSMVFELLGGTFVLALIKIAGDETGMLGFADLLNTEKACPSFWVFSSR